VEPQASVVQSSDVLVTPRLRLQRWGDSHFADFLGFMRDPAVIRYIRPLPLSDEKGVEHHARSLEEWEIHGFGKRAVLDAATGEWLGFVELSLVGPGKGCREEDVEIGYFIVPARWGEGIATEAAIAVRDEAFRRVGLDALIGRSRVENGASARVMAKAGFRHVRSYTLDEGVTVDIHRISRDEWTRNRLGTLLQTTGPMLPCANGDRRGGYRETG
jgi:RimJ/RimL family protein N-acetyltransferase